MALRGVKVLELAGLAPAPFCGMILADFGASVTRVDRMQDHSMDTMARGKRSVSINLKKPAGADVLRRLCKRADVLIEPFRPGVMEKMGVGPERLLQDNPRLVYARLTGFGQKGAYAQMAGHDINYIAVSGMLSMLGRYKEKPYPPINLLADFAGGGMVCALGIVMALLERSQSGKGQVVEADMVKGSAYIGTFLKTSQKIGLFQDERGKNLLDTGAPFYDTFETSDGKYMAVGALESHFYKLLLKGLELNEEDLPQQMSMTDWPQMKQVIARRFASRTQAEWVKVFDGTDACVTAVLSVEEAAAHPHNRANRTYFQSTEGETLPSPAPDLSRTPASPVRTSQPMVGEHTTEVLGEAGFSPEEIHQLTDQEVVHCQQKSSL